MLNPTCIIQCFITTDVTCKWSNSCSINIYQKQIVYSPYTLVVYYYTYLFSRPLLLFSLSLSFCQRSGCRPAWSVWLCPGQCEWFWGCRRGWWWLSDVGELGTPGAPGRWPHCAPQSGGQRGLGPGLQPLLRCHCLLQAQGWTLSRTLTLCLCLSICLLVSIPLSVSVIRLCCLLQSLVSEQNVCHGRETWLCWSAVKGRKTRTRMVMWKALRGCWRVWPTSVVSHSTFRVSPPASAGTSMDKWVGVRVGDLWNQMSI